MSKKPLDFSEYISGYIVSHVIPIIFSILIIFAVLGLCEGSHEYSKCDPFLTKRYHYILPTYPMACNMIKWLREDVKKLEE